MSLFSRNLLLGEFHTFLLGVEGRIRDLKVENLLMKGTFFPSA